MNVLFLYTRLNGFFEAFLEELNKDPLIENISVIHHSDSGNGNLFSLKTKSNIRYYSRADFSKEKLYDFIVRFKPVGIYVSGWVDKGYIYSIRKYKGDYNCKVIVGIDDQWRSKWRQRIGSFIYRVLYKDSVFDYMWVSGPRQYYYARRFGHNDSNIIFDLLSADRNIFSPCLEFRLKRFIYVGRFDEGKGVLELASAFSRLTNIEKNGWELHLIGAGPLLCKLKRLCSLDNHIVLRNYMQPSELAVEMSRGGVGCLVSSFEQWGVVVHEYCSTGLPLLITREVGAGSSFAINGYNSLIVSDNNEESLREGILFFCGMEDSEIKAMSARSVALSNRLSLNTSCGNFLSVFSKGNLA
jgi:glycosyltransferase involved in cell wall biosynthesis